MKPCYFHREADEEYLRALQYYTRISLELAGRFYDEIERLLGEIRATPGRFREIRPAVRRHFSRVFPYGILFADRPDEIVILAVIHLSRRPDYWAERAE